MEAEAGDYGSSRGDAATVELIDFDLAFGMPVQEGTEAAQEQATGDSIPDDADEHHATEQTPPTSAADLGLGSGDLSLVDDDAVPTSTSREVGDRFQHDMADLERRISTLELVDDTPVRGPEQANGAVLVMAGIGGPDAVRQFLAALPGDFPRPVLVQQRLDGGRHDRLVAQMQRATQLPVRLAEAGHAALPGHVYVLPTDVGLKSSNDGMSFVQGGSLLDALPSADSAVLMLSGSDAELVDAVVKHGYGGALIAGQAPEGCYDAAAPAELAARGGQTGQPAELASRLAERWPG